MTMRHWGIVMVVAALAISLLVNVFALSFIAGRWSAGGSRVDAAAFALPYPEPIRAATREVLRENRVEVIAALARLRRARLAMFEEARRPDIDRGALDKAMAEVRAATTALQEVAQAALAKALLAASAQERARISGPAKFDLLPENQP